MAFVISQASIFKDGVMQRSELSVGSAGSGADAFRIFNFNNCVVFSGFTDVHVHLREPGFSYKETIASGSRAAAAGGFTTACAMPNLSPTPDCAASLEAQLSIIRRDAVINVLPYGTITQGERGEALSDMESMAADCAGFSDDGVGVMSDELMRSAMEKANRLDKLIAAHCEDKRYSPEDERSEWKMMERDIALLREQPCKYHVCHVSCAKSLELIREAKAEGLDISCETAPHYLLLDNTMLRDEGHFKMNPPIRTPDDRLALIEALRDGTVDIISTDHAPHSAEEKSRGFSGSLNGIVGLETAFPALYTGLVLRGELSLARLVELLSDAPNRRFGIGGGMDEGDLTVFDLNESYAVDTAAFLSMGRSTPFEGMEVYGRCKLTACKGRIAYASGEL